MDYLVFKCSTSFYNRRVNVVILEQTQNYSKKTKSGLVFGDSVFNPDVVFMDGNGCTYTFSVTLKDGKRKSSRQNPELSFVINYFRKLWILKEYRPLINRR